jgi:hypothetical protein
MPETAKERGNGVNNIDERYNLENQRRQLAIFFKS